MLASTASAVAVATSMVGCNAFLDLGDYHVVDDPTEGTEDVPSTADRSSSGGLDSGSGRDTSTSDVLDSGIQPDAKHVFVTSGYWYAKQIGGPEGANDLCRSAAKAAGRGDVAWVAWMSTSTQNAKDGIAFHGAYLDFDENVIAANFDELVSGTLQNPIGLSEKGTHPCTSLDQAPVWTGTNPDGTLATTNAADNCAEYKDGNGAASTGIVGSCMHHTSEWTNATPQSCVLYPARLYCFEL